MKGLKVSDIVTVLIQIPEKLLKAVIEVTMDHSDVMNAVVREVFTDARITIDCFHTVQIVGDAIEGIRMQSKREAVKEEKKEKTEFSQEVPKICREASEGIQGQETWAQACTCQCQIHNTYNAVQRRHSKRPPQKVQEYASAMWREVD